MKLSYRQRLFVYFGALFTLFTIGVVVFVEKRERTIKTQALEEKLEVYTDLIAIKIKKNPAVFSSVLEGFSTTLPNELRITIIDAKGEVVYDNSVDDVPHMTNHSKRPELLQAKKEGRGSDIRLSTSNQKKYLYYAEQSDNYFIRVALPYNVQLQRFLRPGNAFFYFMIAFFGVFLFFIHFVTNRFGKSVKQLRDFAVNEPHTDGHSFYFPNDELGEIGRKITENYQQLNENKVQLQLEKQKLLQHIQIVEEGICFVSSNNAIDFYNGLFLQYLNFLLDDAVRSVDALFSDTIFSEFQQFISDKKHTFFETKLTKQARVFSMHVHLFEDGSYEIILNDITKQEKTKQLKQEMTGNVAHELRTPVTSIRGYLETVLEQELPLDKKHHFIRQAHNQTLVLSEIIQDMSLIAKMEEAPLTFALSPTNLFDTVQAAFENLEGLLMEKKMIFQNLIPSNCLINGNASLMYSLFRNLIENASRYAGMETTIVVQQYHEDTDFIYLIFYDTGKGIADEKHLNRIFERFYRVNEGRTRDTGGSGLGLSIVRNAVLFHKGKISVKNRKEGGLEFLIQLHK